MSKEKEIEAMFLNTEPNWDESEVAEEDSFAEEDDVEEEQTSLSDDADDEEEEAEPDESFTDSEVDKEPQNADQLFELKHFDDVRRVNRDDVIKLAQMGLDYDRIRKEYDSLKKFKGKEDHFKFLEELAAAYEQPIDDVIEDWRIRKIAEDENISEAEAKANYYKKMAKESGGKKHTELSEEEKRQNDFAEMSREYPDLNPKDIPKEVWAEYGKGKSSLLAIYSKYEIKKLREESKKNESKNKNSKRSMGSVKTAGKSKAVTWGSSLNDDL